ncbi:MAG: hypothetical protein ABH950_00815 [Candidatus Altiarchaeota archaeon]
MDKKQEYWIGNILIFVVMVAIGVFAFNSIIGAFVSRGTGIGDLPVAEGGPRPITTTTTVPCYQPFKMYVSPYTIPNPVVAWGGYDLVCPLNLGVDCITAYVDGQQCTYVGRQGTYDARFRCPSSTATPGTHTALCVSNPGTPNNCCAAEKSTQFAVPINVTTTTVPATFCNDTDGGNNPFVWGIAYNNTHQSNDTCSGNEILWESQCIGNNYVVNLFVNCTDYGMECVNGECVNQTTTSTLPTTTTIAPEISCNDSDGGDYPFIAGEVICNIEGPGEILYPDMCITNTELLRERYIIDVTAVEARIYNCTQLNATCLDGILTPEGNASACVRF